MFPCRSRGGSGLESFPAHELSRAEAVAEKRQVTGRPEAAYLLSAAALGRREKGDSFVAVRGGGRQFPPGFSLSSAQFPDRAPVPVPPEPPPPQRSRCRRPCARPGAAASLALSLLLSSPRGGGVRGRGAEGSGCPSLPGAGTSRGPGWLRGDRRAPLRRSYRRLPPAARATCSAAGGRSARFPLPSSLSPFRGGRTSRAGSAAPPPAPAAGGEEEAPLRPGTSRPAAPGWGPARPSPPLGAGGDAGRAVPSDRGGVGPAGLGWAAHREKKRSSWDQLRRAGPGNRLVRGKARGGLSPGPGSRPGRCSRSSPARKRRRCRVGGGFSGMEMSKSPFLAGSRTSAA